MRTERTTPAQILTAGILKAGLRKTQAAYLQILLMLWLVIPGRINFTNKARYHPITEKTHRNWSGKPVPWVQLNATLVLQAQDQQLLSRRGALGVDAVHISKYGQHTPDVASYWSGCQGRSVHGLESTCVTWIDPLSQQPIVLSMTQTPAELPEGHSRVDFYATATVNTIVQLPETLRAQIQAVVGDAYYYKRVFVNRVLDEGQLPFVGKMRRDANLKHLYTGPRTGQPGRPKKYDGKVSLKEFARWDVIPYAQECTVFTTVAYAVQLKRVVRLVALLWPAKNGHTLELLFSTDTSMDAATIIGLYRSRFAMEFPFRDAKQFAGLNHCQSRRVESLHFHWNMAMLCVSVARLSQLKNQRAGPLVFSMEDEKRRAYNEFFAQRILSKLPDGLSDEKLWQQLESLLCLGVKAA